MLFRSLGDQEVLTAYRTCVRCLSLVTSGSLLPLLVVTFPISLSCSLCIFCRNCCCFLYRSFPALHLLAKLAFVVLALLFLPAPVGSVFAPLHSPFRVQQQPNQNCPSLSPIPGHSAVQFLLLSAAVFAAAVISVLVNVNLNMKSRTKVMMI